MASVPSYKGARGEPPWLPSLHIARRLTLWVTVVVGYTAIVALVVLLLRFPHWNTGGEAAAALSAVLGALLVFRMNAANDRWWEARKLWGQLINEVRNLALKAQAHAEVGAEEHRELGRLLVGFGHALRLHLRGVGGVTSVPGFEREPTDFPHAPGYVAGRIHDLLNRWNRRGSLRETIWILDIHARALMDVCGGCERIRNTPLISSYRSLLRIGIAFNILFAAWSAALDHGWWSVPAIGIAACFLLGIELTAEEVEEPFGVEKDDLPLESYCQAIETFVAAVLRTDLGSPPAHEDGPPRAAGEAA